MSYKLKAGGKTCWTFVEFHTEKDIYQSRRQSCISFHPVRVPCVSCVSCVSWAKGMARCQMRNRVLKRDSSGTSEKEQKARKGGIRHQPTHGCGARVCESKKKIHFSLYTHYMYQRNGREKRTLILRNGSYSAITFTFTFIFHVCGFERDQYSEVDLKWKGDDGSVLSKNKFLLKIHLLEKNVSITRDMIFMFESSAKFSCTAFMV